MINAGILVFNDVEELDFTSPFEVLSYVKKIKPDSINVWLIGTDEKTVKGFNGLRFIADYTIDDCPNLDVLVIPGGQGRKTAMKKTKGLNFVNSRYSELKYLSSVCTGSFIIASAGLLKDKHATTYHTAFDELSEMGVLVEKSKVVQDGKIITGAGVSSGIDVALFLVSKLFDETTAQEVADKIEYNWHKEYLSYS